MSRKKQPRGLARLGWSGLWELASERAPIVLFGWHQHDVLLLAGQRVERDDDRPLVGCPRRAVGPYTKQAVERAGGNV